jgi:hypothetical protein
MENKFTTADLRARAAKLEGQGDTVAMLIWAADTLDAAIVLIDEFRRNGEPK